jgi:hypothetical protein
VVQEVVAGRDRLVDHVEPHLAPRAEEIDGRDEAVDRDDAPGNA